MNEVTDNKAGIVFGAKRDWDKAARRKASIEKARRLLGYEPKGDVKSNLRKVHEWFLKNSELIKSSVRF